METNETFFKLSIQTLKTRLSTEWDKYLFTQFQSNLLRKRQVITETNKKMNGHEYFHNIPLLTWLQGMNPS